ncbi:CBF/Mak21 family domain-containing protein [Ditylenchus destructor]|nr:CBF/Mak21 family domain-containing protein [Ditylenchus destructor]
MKIKFDESGKAIGGKKDKKAITAANVKKFSLTPKRVDEGTHNVVTPKEKKSLVTQKRVDEKAHHLIQHVEGSKWFDYQFDEVNDHKQSQGETVNSGDKSKMLEDQAAALLNRDIELYEAWYRSKNKSDADWLTNVANKGTFADRLSVVQLKVQRSPVHTINHLIQLVAIVEKKGLRESTSALKVLKDLFVQDLLPPNRKLVFLKSRPVNRYNETEDKSGKKKRLIMWKFEADLKECYQKFTHALQEMAGSAVEGVAQNTCTAMAELLWERPEQEQFLLTALVNKLGHPTHKIGAKVAQLLETLVEKHTKMRLIVVNEVKQLIFRKNISEKAQNYAVHFLRRIMLNAGESDLAFVLIQIYLALFRIIIANDKHDHKLLPLLIAGVNKAFPYAKGKTEGLVNEVEGLYTLVQTSKLSTALNVLKLLFQIHNNTEGLSDRFYQSFYRRLLNIHSTSMDEQFFSLIQKVLQNDSVLPRVRAFLKRLFQISLASTPAFAASSLLICSMLMKDRPNLLNLPSQEKTVKLELESGIKIEQPESNGPTKSINSKFLDDDDSDEMESSKGNDNMPHGWIHRRISSSKKGAKRPRLSSSVNSGTVYDPHARNPLFARADLAVDVELSLFAKHYHPTVASLAKDLLEGNPIKFGGDPLVDLSTMRFLEGIVLKTPATTSKKKQKDKSGKSSMKEEKNEDIEDEIGDPFGNEDPDIDADLNGDDGGENNFSGGSDAEESDMEME